MSPGLQVEYPADLFGDLESPERGIGEHFRTAGRSRPAKDLLAPNDARYLGAVLAQQSQGVADSPTISGVTPLLSRIPGTYQGAIYYSRCNSSNAGGAVHCFDLRYPEREKRAWDDIVTRISRSLRPLMG